MATFTDISICRWLRTRWLLAATALIIETCSCVGILPEVAAQELQPVPTLEPAYETNDVAFRGIPSVAEPLWTNYALTEALFWGRDNQAANVPLVTAVGSGATLISAGDPQFPVAAGVRAFYGERNPNECGWELGYFGVYGMSASRFASTTPPQFPTD